MPDDPSAARSEDEIHDRLADVVEDLDSRWPESRLEPTLSRVRSVLDLMANPEATYPVIHVAGTNGKTSTARMIDALLLELGLHTGRVTSPHLTDVRERITLDGRPVDLARFVAAHEDVEPYVGIVDARNEERGAPRLSYFELLTVMAFATFSDAPIDVAVVEAGMGGTWDATNVVDSAVAIITPIGLDHQAYLGDTIEAIAGEKAGIVKPGAFVVLAQQEPAAAEVVLRQAGQLEATVAREGLEFGVVARELAVGGQLLTLKGLAGEYDGVFLPLHGVHQAHNAACALAAVEAFLGGGATALDLDVVRSGFAAVTSPGRLEAVRRGPTVLLDAAHNPAGARALATALAEEFAFERLVAVVAMLDDKDAASFLEAIEPVVDAVVVTAARSPRSLDVDTLSAVAEDVFGSGRVSAASGLVDAIDVALADAETASTTGGAGVLVTGSVVAIGEARALLRRDEPDPIGGD